MTQFDSGRPDMWLSLALFSALILGVRRIYEKELSASFGNFTMGFLMQSFAILPMLLLFFFFPIPQDVLHLPFQFWWPLVVIWIVCYPVQTYFLYRALREGELSQVTPVVALMPVFNVLTSFALIGELPSVFGGGGIALAVVGTYLLLTDARAKGQEFNMPVLFMIVSVVATALGSTLDKIAVEASTPVFYSFVNLVGAAVVFLILMYARGELHELRRVKEKWITLTVLGIFLALAFVAFITAFSLGPTSYTLAVRSGGYLVAALWGLFFLHESHSRRKIFALGLFVLGTVFLALG